MAKALIIWRTWFDADMANSDSYHATKAEALTHIREQYDVRARDLKPDADDDPDVWRGAMPEDAPCGTYCYLERLEVVPTRAGIAHALTYVPHR